ncbi:pyridoxamine 5'-phosphate oxidase family protein [Candidatus Bathyarchaeota archaeon]|nr:pyridoxamine 5'-phosphate oxidase family protein [Candidatus Bathyarchaeota archaeon]
MVRVKLPRMSKAEIDQLLSEQFLCRIAFGGKQAPYIAPFQYVSVGGSLYFHFTDYGRKMGLLEEGKPVCVEIERYTQDLGEYCFVTLVGKLHVVTDVQEKAKAVARMVEDAKAKGLSTNFLPAHGLPKEADWSALKAEKPLVVVKLVDVAEIVGLKSP